MDWWTEVKLIVKEKKGELVCGMCHRTISLHSKAIGQFMRHGWPICCDRTMELKPYKYHIYKGAE